MSFTIREGDLRRAGRHRLRQSTLVHLLDRLYDVPEGSGRITIGGVDLRHIRRSDLRRHRSCFCRSPFLFSQTIGRTSGPCAPMRRRDAMRRAAPSPAWMIGDLPSRGMTPSWGSGGVTLSGGQKQRVAIARMLMQQAPVMIFDDSLSAVDAETDEKIRTALRRSTGNATVLLISHRVTTLMQADRILVLDGGRVAAGDPCPAGGKARHLPGYLQHSDAECRPGAAGGRGSEHGSH